MSPRTKELRKRVFKYPGHVHGPFGHVCTHAHANENVVPLLFTTPTLRQHKQPPIVSTTPSTPVFPPLDKAPKHGPK